MPEIMRRPGRPATPGNLRGAWYGRGVGMGVGDFDWGTFAQQVTTGTFDVVKQITQKPGQFIQTSGGVISTGVPGATPAGSGFSLNSNLGTATVGGGLNSNTLLLGGALLAGLVFALKR